MYDFEKTKYYNKTINKSKKISKNNYKKSKKQIGLGLDEYTLLNKKSNILISQKQKFVNDYYQYILSLIINIINENNFSINVNLDDSNADFDNQNKTLNIKVNYEHTLVKQGGRDIPSNTKYGKILIDKNNKYLVRISRFDILNSSDIIIDYSIPNIINVRESKLYDTFSKKHIYLAPCLYKNIEISTNNRFINLLTTFRRVNEPRRKKLLEKISLSKIDHTNVNDCFHKNKLKKLYRNTKVLLNIHSTPHHNTFEELRCLPALQNGVIVVAEKSPLYNLIPYKDLIIWCSYSNIIEKTKEVLDSYNIYHKKIFSKKNVELLKSLHGLNKKTIKNKIISLM